MTDSATAVKGLVEHLFRHEAGRMVGVLTRRLGAEYLELAEDVVQEALMAALRAWPYSGVPPNPSGWLMRVARNRAIDRIRRATNLRGKLDQLRPVLELSVLPEQMEEGVDDQLAMILMCCHPLLTRESQVALTLKTVSGFGVAEIARALLARPDAITRRITRARQQLRDAGVTLALPEGNEMRERLGPVCDVLYLLFNEGYAAHGGGDLIRAELCDEAVRLTEVLTRSQEGDTSDVHALLALMCFQSSRLGARIDDDGAMVLLSDQDRRLWDDKLIDRGVRHLSKAGGGTRLTAYHLEAAIAACHATARDFASTNWKRVLSLYETLTDLQPSPVARLNQAVAVSQVHGPEAAMGLLEEVAMTRALDNYYLLPAMQGDLWVRMGRRCEALACFRRAISMPCSAPERAFLERRILAVSGLDDSANARSCSIPRCRSPLSVSRPKGIVLLCSIRGTF